MITTSEIRTYSRCREEWRLSYGLGVRPRVADAPLRFGTLVHVGLEAWWLGRDWPRALDGVEGVDAFDRAKALALLLGYSARWGRDRENVEVLGVEQKFTIERDGFVFGGKLDVLVRNDTRVYVVEHKTSREDVSPGSDYWSRLTIDDQLSNYLAGARSLGFDVAGCVYDVLAVPTLEPRLATPEEKRRYTKAGVLYANQRTEDEPPEEYEARLIQEVTSDFDAYFQRGEIVRLEAESKRAREELRVLAHEIMAAEREPEKPQPRNPGACRRYGRPCVYLPVCAGETDLFDSRYRQATEKHEELQ